MNKYYMAWITLLIGSTLNGVPAMAGFLDSPWPRHGDLDGIFFRAEEKRGWWVGDADAL
jgi:hypothetical protein